MISCARFRFSEENSNGICQLESVEIHTSIKLMTNLRIVVGSVAVLQCDTQ